MMGAMKQSGIDWIGEIPSEWDVIRMKLYAYLKGRIGWQGLKAEEFIDEGPYLVTGTDFENGRICWERSYHVSEKRYNEAPQIQLRVGDLLVTKDGTIGKLAYVDSLPGKASLNSHLLLIRPLKGKFCNEYLYWVLGSSVFQGYYELTGQDGTTMDSLSQEKIGNFNFATPPLAEQQAIAAFLDDRCAHVDGIIADLERQAEILRQYKKALITETVTKGLDKTVPMKDSGIDWIGEIPSHWEVKPLKYCVSINQNVLLESTNPNYEFRYIDIGSVTFDRGIIDYTETTFENAPSRARRIVRSGDTIISTVRTYLKAIARIEDDDNVIVSTGFAVLSPHQYLNPFYLELFIKSDLFCDEISKQSSGIAYPAINASQLGRIALLIPPSEEQEEIARFLQQKCAETDALITEKQRAIEKMRQYKKSLIYEYVTGKKRVAS